VRRVVSTLVGRLDGEVPHLHIRLARRELDHRILAGFHGLHRPEPIEAVLCTPAASKRLIPAAQANQGFGVLCFDGYCSLLSAKGYDHAVHESGMSEKAEAERVEAVHKTGSQWKRAEGGEFEDHIEMVSLGRAAAPGAKRSRRRLVQGIQPQRVSKHREGAEIRSAIHDAKARQPQGSLYDFGDSGWAGTTA